MYFDWGNLGTNQIPTTLFGKKRKITIVIKNQILKKN